MSHHSDDKNSKSDIKHSPVDTLADLGDKREEVDNHSNNSQSDSQTQSYDLQGESSSDGETSTTAGTKPDPLHSQRPNTHHKSKQTTIVDYFGDESGRTAVRGGRQKGLSNSKSTDARKERKLKVTTTDVKNSQNPSSMGNSSSSSDEDKNAQGRAAKRRFDDSDSWRFSWSRQDTNDYRDKYPNKKDDNKSLNNNLHFYQNRIPSYPDGDYIDNIHKHWIKNYAKLERHHGYIQWLFPIREPGMNYQAQELQLHEAEAIRNDPEAKERVLKSYELMLDFYGMKLDRKTCYVERADNWRERFDHLNRSFHNYLRITRMLKSLGELGYEKLKYPFCEFVLEEIRKRNLRNCRESCCNYWIHTLRDDEERKKVIELVDDLSKSCK